MALISNNIKTGFLIQKHSKWTFVFYFCKVNKKLWLFILVCNQFESSLCDRLYLFLIVCQISTFSIYKQKNKLEETHSPNDAIFVR